MEEGRLTGGMNVREAGDCEPGEDRMSRSGLFGPRSQQEPDHGRQYRVRGITRPGSSPSRTTHKERTGANG